MKRKTTGLVSIIFGVLILLIIKRIAPPCMAMPDGKFMKCHWMGQAQLGLGIFLIVIGIIELFIKIGESTFKYNLINISLGGYCILLVTNLIGSCGLQDMRCNLSTKPLILTISTIFIVINIIAGVNSKKAKI